MPRTLGREDQDPVETAGPPRIWKIGEKVRITYGVRTVIGKVELATKNGLSLYLSFQTILGGHVGGMPVLWRQESGYRAIMSGAPIGISDAAPTELETRVFTAIRTTLASSEAKTISLNDFAFRLEMSVDELGKVVDTLRELGLLDLSIFSPEAN